MFWQAGGSTYWWTATEYSETNAYERSMSTKSNNVGESNYFSKNYAYSARCVYD